MSERERWIVYPLLFFALGAAIRDKILHRVDAKEIYCESLKIIDQQDPLGQAFVEISIERNNPTDPTQIVEQFGQLRIIDRQGTRVCQMDSKSLQLVSMPERGKQAIAELRVLPAGRVDAADAIGEVGVLRLVNSEGKEVCLVDSNSLQLVSQPEPGKQAFAELRIKKANSNDPTALADEVGMLRLVDSEGRVLSALNEKAFLRRVISEQVDIVDPNYQRRVLISTEESPDTITPEGEPAFTSQGVILLNNPRVGLKIAPPARPQPTAELPTGSDL
ncbi:MAG: hypothetical protein AAGD11_10170 [Planctomycetota bacterium]